MINVPRASLETQFCVCVQQNCDLWKSEKAFSDSILFLAAINHLHRFITYFITSSAGVLDVIQAVCVFVCLCVWPTVVFGFSPRIVALREIWGVRVGPGSGFFFVFFVFTHTHTHTHESLHLCQRSVCVRLFHYFPLISSLIQSLNDIERLGRMWGRN